jgi:membrane dipeptidase
VLIIDAHLDLAMNALQWNRDLCLSVHTIRAQEAGSSGKSRGQGTVAFPEMAQGRISLCFATLIARSTGQLAPHIDYARPAQAYGIAQGQLAYYRALERAGCVCIVANQGELERHMAEWAAWESRAEDPSPVGSERDFPPLGFVIAMEGADPIVDPDQLEEWWAAGLRVVALTHYGPGRYAGGTATELGLSALGPALLAEMDRLGMILDLTHCSDLAFWQALEHFNGPVLGSHQNARALVPHQRQWTDEQIEAVIERDGVIGASCDVWMLAPGWSRGDSNDGVTLGTLADHIDYVCQMAGNSCHAAIGSDLDGGFGRDQSPSDLETIADLQRLSGILANRGYGQEDIANIMHRNWLRLLHQSWEA